MDCLTGPVDDMWTNNGNQQRIPPVLSIIHKLCTQGVDNLWTTRTVSQMNLTPVSSLVAPSQNPVH